MTEQDKELEQLLKDNKELKLVLEKVESVLRPFADRVFNDNGDMTINTSSIFPTEVFQTAYFINKRIKNLLTSSKE